MGRKAGVISIDIDAGTAKFLVDMDKANTKLAQMGKTATEAGHATVSSMQASSAAIRLLENPAGNNVRAIERLISLAPGAAQLMQNIFIPVAGFAAAGMIGRMGEEVYNFIEKISQAPQRIANAFHAIDEPLRMTNDELALSNIRLENTTAKLEGKPQNRVAEALLEAKVQADKLADSLDQDFAKLHKLLDEETHNSFMGLFYGQSGTSDIKDDMEAFQRQVDSANGDPAKLNEIYGNKILEYAKKAHDEQTIAAEPNLTGFMNEERAAMTSKTLQYLIDQLARVNLTADAQSDETKHAKAQGDHDARVAADEARKKALEVTARLQAEAAAAAEKNANALDRIDIAERERLQQLQAENGLTKENLDYVHQIYDTDRLTEYGRIAQEYAQMQLEWAQKLHGVVQSTYETQFAPGIAEAVKNFEQGAKAAEEWAKATNKITGESASESLRHRVAMAGANGNPNDPLGTLRIQQAIEEAQIADTYEQKLALAANDLDRQRALNEKNLELLKLQNQMEEKTAQLQHKNLDDFFTEMQSGSKTAGDVLYDSMHSALDQISADFATLLAHPEKTNVRHLFGDTFKSLGQSTSHEAIKSLMERGLGAFGRSSLGQKLGIHVGGKPDGSTEALAMWVRLVGLDPAGQPGGLLGQYPKSIPGGGNPLGGLIPRLPGGLIGGYPLGGGLGGMIPELPAGTSPADAPFTLPGGLINRTGSSVDGIPSLFGGLLHGLGGSDGASSIPFGGMMAGGGDVDPGFIYGVNDGSGREFFQPKTAGTIIPPEKMGGATHYHSYQVDARGAQLGVENRVSRAIESAHNSAVSNSVRASSERAKRTPRRSN